MSISSIAAQTPSGVFASEVEYQSLQAEVQSKVNQKLEGLAPDERSRLERVIRAKAREILQEMHLLKTIGCPIAEFAEKARNMYQQLDALSSAGMARDAVFLSRQDQVREALKGSISSVL